MYEPFFNNVISDIALDRGQAQLDLEFEGTNAATELSALSSRDLPSARGGVSGSNSLSSKLPVDDSGTPDKRRAPKPGVRGLSMRWTGVVRR